MAPRLSGQTSILGVIFPVSKSLLGIEGQKKLEKFAILTRKPRSHARILIYRTWPIIPVILFDTAFDYQLRIMFSVLVIVVCFYTLRRSIKQRIQLVSLIRLHNYSDDQ